MVLPDILVDCGSIILMWTGNSKEIRFGFHSKALPLNQSAGYVYSLQGRRGETLLILCIGGRPLPQENTLRFSLNGASRLASLPWYLSKGTDYGVWAWNEYQFKSTICPYCIYFIWKHEGKPRGKCNENGSWSNGTYVRGWTVCSSCEIRVQGRGFLNVVLKVKAGNFLTNLATVSVQWS
jgi:hypothetical protein